MAKGNGMTRGQSSAGGFQGSREGLRAERWMSDEGWREVLDELESDAYPRGWDDIDPDHRELALMEAGFTGLASEGAEDIIFQVDKEHILDYVSDQLLNMWTGDNFDEDTMITIGHKDGRTYTNDEIEPARRVTRNQSYSTQRDIIRQTAVGRDVSFVLVNGGWGSVYYEPNGASHIGQYTGYEKWTRGRGTKRRDYIQDDWI